jgi:hypothetical protein
VSYLIFHANPWIFVILLLVVLIAVIETAYRFMKAGNFEGRHVEAVGTIQTGLFTLTSFVIGLSFAQASARFDVRRDLVVKEANAIGTTWLRADLLPPADASEFRRVLTSYTQARLDAYQTPNDPQLYERTTKVSDDDQRELWRLAAGALRNAPTNLNYSLLMQSLNDTIDVSAEQLQALTTHVPTAAMVLTLLLVVLSALSLGLRFGLNRSRPPTLTIIFIVAYVLVINMMIDYDRPQSGFVRVNLDPLRLQLQSMQPRA